MNFVYIITENEDGDVIIAASTKEIAIEQLHKFTGYGSPNNDVIFNGFVRNDFAGDIMGTITYDCKYGKDTEYSKSVFNLFMKKLDEL